MQQSVAVFEELDPDALWRHYQRGYLCLVRSGMHFRRLLRPAFSHVYFQRAMPLLVDYAHANHGKNDLPPGFADKMEACPLTARDLLHLDYAICLGFAEAQGDDPVVLSALPVLEWPGPITDGSIFTAADALIAPAEDLRLEEYADVEETPVDDDDPKAPFDL